MKAIEQYFHRKQMQSVALIKEYILVKSSSYNILL